MLLGKLSHCRRDSVTDCLRLELDNTASAKYNVRGHEQEVPHNCRPDFSCCGDSTRRAARWFRSERKGCEWALLFGFAWSLSGSFLEHLCLVCSFECSSWLGASGICRRVHNMA